MNKKIIINADHFETRIAILNDDQLCELHIERKNKERLVGNIYQGRVINILPGINAAFIDIAMEQNAFCYLSDPVMKSFEKTTIAPADQPRLALPHSTGIAPGKVLPVQVYKNRIGTKGARVSTTITLPGRYLVFLPMSPGMHAISRRIKDPDERRRLSDIATQITPAEYGIIIRTASVGVTEELLQKDIDDLIVCWKSIEKRAKNNKQVGLLHEEINIISRLFRELPAADISEVVIDAPEQHQRLLDFLAVNIPQLIPHIKLFDEPRDIFEFYGIEGGIERALRPIVYLKCGGYIIFDMAEALVAVDVNTGKYTGKNNLDETAFVTNMDAAAAIAHQIILRDIGGIIVIDFIHMASTEDRTRVVEQLKKSFGEDKIRCDIADFSEFGLVEITRKRTNKNLRRTLCQPCPCCKGRGSIKSALTMSLTVLRKLRQTCKNQSGDNVNFHAHSSVTTYLAERFYERIKLLEAEFSKNIVIVSDDTIARESFHIDVD